METEHSKMAADEPHSSARNALTAPACGNTAFQPIMVPAIGHRI